MKNLRSLSLLALTTGSSEGLKTLNNAQQKQQPYQMPTQVPYNFNNGQPMPVQMTPSAVPATMPQMMQQQTVQQPFAQTQPQQFAVPQQAQRMQPSLVRQDALAGGGASAPVPTIAGGNSGAAGELCSDVDQKVCAQASWMDGKFITYKNGCWASQMGFQPVEVVGTGFPHYTAGPCNPIDAATENYACTEDSPVCVKDMFVHMDPMNPKPVTFQNACVAQKYFQTRWTQVSGTSNYQVGRCSVTCKDPCEWFQPMCGVDHTGNAMTYPNRCAADNAASVGDHNVDNGWCNRAGGVINPALPHFLDMDAWKNSHAAPEGFTWQNRPFLVPAPKETPPLPMAPQPISRIVQFSVQQCIEIRLVCIRTRDGDFRTYMNRCLAQEDGYTVSVDDPPNNFQNDIAHLRSSMTEEIGECRENAHQRYIRKSEHGSPEAGCEKLAPVCSVDGLITFMNKCQAHKMGFTDVSKLVRGACYNAALSDDRKKFDPVCDKATQITWLNAAYMNQWNQVNNRNNAAHDMGACSRWTQVFRSEFLGESAVLQDVCKFEQYLDPVCHTNTNSAPITFLNRCMMHISGLGGGGTPGACAVNDDDETSSSTSSSLSLIQRGATPRLNPLQQGLVSYPYYRRYEEFYNPAGPSEKFGKFSEPQALSLFQHYAKGLKEKGGNFLGMLSDLKATKDSYQKYFGKKMDVMSEVGPSDSGAMSDKLISPTSTSGHWSLTLPNSALWALKNCTTIEPICDVQENLITHVNWCMAQRAGVQSSVGTLYKACPAGGMTVQDTACSTSEMNQPCVAGARFNNRCAAWEAGETNIRKAVDEQSACLNNHIGTASVNQCDPNPADEDAVCNLAGDPVPLPYDSMCLLQKASPSFWLPFILEGKCVELAHLSIKIQGIWPRCATVQEAFDKFNATFESAVTDALLQIRSQSAEWADLNAFGWAFGATCHSCAGSATGCMMQKIEKLGLLGDEIDIPEFPEPENLYNVFRSSNWHKDETPATTQPPAQPAAAATTSGGGSSSTSFVQTETTSSSKKVESSPGRAMTQSRGVHSPDWRKMNSLRELEVKVGLRCHQQDDARCALFTAQVFADPDKMKEFSSTVQHYLDQALQVHNAVVLEATDNVVGGEQQLAWTLSADNTVQNMYAILDQGKAIIMDEDGGFQAFVACNPASLCEGPGFDPSANTGGSTTR